MSTHLPAETGEVELKPSPEQRFDWPVCYEAEELLLKHVRDLLARNSFAGRLASRMHEETGTLILDWLDYLVLPLAEEAELRTVGLVPDAQAQTPPGMSALYHPSALLPRALLAPGENPCPMALGVRVESLMEFLAVHRLGVEPEGAPMSRFRRVVAWAEKGARLEVVERRGYRGFALVHSKPGEVEALLKAQELWRTRQRLFESAGQGYRNARALLERLLELVGRDLACSVVFEGERAYWQRRNRAAQVQKLRQDSLGLGWANHDHHTFRSSREHFLDLMAVLEMLGFERRERYYAGRQAGWGAQILEQPVEGIVVFADLDLLPGETEVDFSRQPLPASPSLGTVGLWVALHGESFLEAGMHHLEARFDFALVREQLKACDVGGMAPFSNFEFLKQAFTEGERWPVRPERIRNLVAAGLITAEQGKRFGAEGAIGSHLETLQRRGGFKGFNQQSVSAIIAETDPRKNAPANA